MAELMGLRDSAAGLRVYQLLCGEDIAVPSANHDPGARVDAELPSTLDGLVELGATIGMSKEQVMSLLDAINGDLEATARYILEDGGASSSASYPLTPDQQQQRQFETATRMANFVYVIVDDETHTAATVDAAWDVESVLTFAKSLGATVTTALYTHRHEDHVGGRSPRSGNLRAGASNMAAAGATVYCMAADADSVELSTETTVTRLSDGSTVVLGSHTITAIATPGHTPGSCCYLVGTAGGTVESEAVFTGDTLFVGGFGRMSVEHGTGDVNAMFSSLARLAQLPPGTAVLAGHHFGAQRITSIADEVRHNAAYRCTSAVQLAALAGIAPPPTQVGPIRLNPTARATVETNDQGLAGLDFAGCIVPSPGTECFCCQPMDSSVLRQRASTLDGLFCEEVQNVFATEQNATDAGDMLRSVDATCDMYWLHLPPQKGLPKGSKPDRDGDGSTAADGAVSTVPGLPYRHSIRTVERMGLVAQRRLQRIGSHLCTARHVTRASASGLCGRGVGEVDSTAGQLEHRWQSVETYHELTEHGFPDRYAAGPSLDDDIELSWDDQPSTFRSFIGALDIKLPSRDSELTHWARQSSRVALRDGGTQVSTVFLAAEKVRFSELFSLDGRIAPQEALCPDAVSSFLYHSMATSATKIGGDDEWSLRVVASSGNLHGTEVYCILPSDMISIEHAGGSYKEDSSSESLTETVDRGVMCLHYNVEHHSLTRRATWRKNNATTATHLMQELFNSGCFLLALSTVHWRQAWKYGNRGWRYSELDVGHALCALRISAQVHGWSLRIIAGVTDADLASVIGINRTEDFVKNEGETPAVIVMVGPPVLFPEKALEAVQALAASAGDIAWEGMATRLGEPETHHKYARSTAITSVIEATELSAKDAAYQLATQSSVRLTLLRNRLEDESTPETGQGALRATTVIRSRRSVWRLVPDASTISFMRFTRILSRVMPGGPHQPPDSPPFDCGLVCADSEGGSCSLLLFIHRVHGLPPGLYILVRDMTQLDALMAGLSSEFGWSLCAPKQDDNTGLTVGARAVPRGPERAVETLQLLASGVLPLFCLAVGDVQNYAKQAMCHQDVAGDGAFSVAMIAPLPKQEAPDDNQKRASPIELAAPVSSSVPCFGRRYREALWECGLIGQMLYLACEAEGEHFHGTSLGCFFDEAVDQVLGLTSRSSKYRCLLGFACGAGVVGELGDDAHDSESWARH